MKKLLALLLAVMLSLTCFVACKGKNNDEKPADTSSPTKVVYDVDDAAAYLKNMYKKYLTETETAADYTLVSQVMKSGVIYTITWTTDRDDIKVIEDKENKQVTIDLNEKTPVDIDYTLTATIADPDGKTATLSFKLKVPKYVLSSWDQYMKLEAGKAVVIEGYVAAIHSQSEGNKYNMLYVHDVNNKGGYYVYSMTADPIKDLNLKKGMLVSVTGTKDIYSGTHEIKDASVNVLDTKVVDFAPLDITNLFKKADSCSDASLVSKLGMLVTIKGVEITDQNTAEKSQYYNFNLDGLTSYVRLYRTDCPCTVSDADMKAIAEQHAAKFGYSADVTGVVVMYGGAIYLNPVDKNCFKYGAKIVRDDAAKVKYEIENISEFGIKTDIKANTQVINLPTKGNRYEDVAISWAVAEDSKGALKLEGSKLTVTLQDAATTAKIKGTFTCNGKTGTVELTLKLAAKQTLVPVADKTPVAGKDYLLFFFQEKNGNYDYFTGEMNGFYGASSLNYEQAVKVRVESVTGGSLLYFTDKDGAKQYITIEESGTHVNFVFKTDKPTTPFTFDANGAPMFKLNDTKSYYIGTYGNYYTFGTQDTTQSDSYIAYLGTMVDTTKVSDADKVATEKNNVKPEVNEVSKDADVKLPTAGTTYSEVTITWASDKDFAVVDNAKGIVTVTLQETEQTVKLTATLKCGTATDTKEFEITVHAIPKEDDNTVTAPIGNKAYKFFVEQVTLGKILYLDGTAGDRYLNTTTDIDKAADVYAEASGNGFKFYILDSTTKKYITLYKNSSNKDALKYDAAGETVFTYAAEVNAWKTTFNDTQYYIGTYNNFNTISASKLSFINSENTGVTQFPVEIIPAKDVVTAPLANKSYTLFADQVTLGKTIYLNGTAGDRYLNTTENIAEAAKVYAEASDDGFKFYILDGTTKKYITLYKNSSNKDALKYDAAGETVFTYDAEVNAWKTTFNDTPYYIGTYNNFNTISASKLSFINSENTGVSQFPVQLQAVENIISNPIAEKEYIISIYQGKLGKTIYLNGTAGDRYLNTTENIAEAAKVYAEASDDGFKFYILDGTTKKYITLYKNSSNKDALKYDAEAGNVFTYDATVNAWKTIFSDTDYYFGTYSTYNTVSASKLSYISAENTGVSQFPAELDVYTAPVTDPGEGDAGIGGGEGGSNTASTDTSFSTSVFAITSKYTTSEAGGWTAINCAVADSTVNNYSLTDTAVVLNGKKDGQGVLTSCLYANGIKSLTFKYGFGYGDTSFDLAIKIKNSAGAVVAETTLNKTGLTKGTVYDYTWTLDTPVSGDFTIEFANLGTNSGNKHRLSIWNISWVNNN